MLARRAILAGLAAWAASPSPGAAARLEIGVGTFTYHGLSLDEMIVRLTALGIRQIEMSRGEFMLFAHPTAEMCQTAKRKLDRAGIECVSYYTATIQNESDLEDAVRFAKIFGATNVSGDATGTLLSNIDKRLTHEGLTFGIHNHWFPTKFAYESVEDVLSALQGLSPTMGATLDVGQMAACGHDPVDAVRRLRTHLKMVHLKDVAAAGAEHNVLFGQGVANIAGVMKELKRIEYRGLVAVEYEKDGIVDADVKQEVEYARALA